MPLITLILFPLIGSLVAAVLPTNARNAESTLAGLIALLCTVQVALCFPAIADGAVLRQELAWLPALGLNLVLRLDGLAWMFCMLVFGVGSLVVLYARYYMSAAHPVPRFFAFFLSCFHGRDGGGGAVGQPHPDRVLLGTDQPVLVPADRLLAPPQRRAARRAHGAVRHRIRRAVPAGGHAGAGPYRGQLRARSGARRRPAHQGPSAVPR